MKRTSTDSGLDPAFGHKGLAALPDDMAQATAIAVRQDQTVLVAGAAHGGRFMVVRLLGSGELDKSFAEQGVLRDQFEPQQTAVAVDVFAVQGDKTLVIYNTTMQNQADIIPVAARYHNDGRLDPSYGIDGVSPLYYPQDTQLTAATGASSAKAQMTPNGGLLTSWWYPSRGRTVTYCLDPNGQPDPAFNQTGYVMLTPALGRRSVSATLLLASGKTLVAGGFTDPEGTDKPFLVKYTTSGKLDVLFGDNGVILLDDYTGCRYTHWLETPDNRLVGFGKTAGQQASLIVLHANGHPDPTFSAHPVIDVWQWTCGMYENGKFTAVGHTTNPHDLVVARYLEDGTPDLDFAGGAGWARFDISGSDETDLPFAVHSTQGALLVSGLTTHMAIGCGFVAKLLA